MTSSLGAQKGVPYEVESAPGAGAKAAAALGAKAAAELGAKAAAALGAKAAAPLGVPTEPPRSDEMNDVETKLPSLLGADAKAVWVTPLKLVSVEKPALQPAQVGPGPAAAGAAAAARGAGAKANAWVGAGAGAGAAPRGCGT